MQWQDLFWKLVRAAVAAALVAGVNFLLLWSLGHFLGPSMTFTIAFVTALAVHFLLSKYWTYRNFNREFTRQVPRYLAAAALSYIIQFGVFWLALKFITKSVLMAGVIAMPLGMITSFTVLLLWVFTFRPSRKSQDEADRAPLAPVTTSAHDLPV